MNIEDDPGGRSPKMPQQKRQGQEAFLVPFNLRRHPPGWPGAQELPNLVSPSAPPCGTCNRSFVSVCRDLQAPDSILAVTQAGLASGSFGWGEKSLEMRSQCFLQVASATLPCIPGAPGRMLWMATLLSPILVLSHLP